MADGSDEDVLEGMEIIALKVEFDLVADWSPVLEKIAAFHGARSRVGVQGDQFVVKVALPPEKKPRFLADVQRYWDAFVERRKREGRWR
jgi:hypothetical protein